MKVSDIAIHGFRVVGGFAAWPRRMMRTYTRDEDDDSDDQEDDSDAEDNFDGDS